MTSIEEDIFHSTLHSKNDDTTYEEAEFSIEDVTKSDLGLLKIGALFYWSVGYVEYNKTIEKRSKLRFKRIIPLKVKEIDRMQDRTEKLLNDIKWT